MGLTKKINFNANVKQQTDSDIFGTSQVAGSSSGINYILNPSAASSTAGWATYQNTAQATPVTGTGGSPHVTFVRNTTTPLRDGADFLFSKDASNRQGEGVSYDFTIDPADKAKLLSVSFDYIVNSGTFNAGSPSTDSDIEMWVYDKTNNILIPVTPFKLVSNSSVTPGTFKGVFQTSSNSVLYRLILHVATTNASAWAVEVDNFAVGPQVILNAPSMGDWTPYSLTVGAQTTPPTFGTVTTNLALSKTIGDSFALRWDFVMTTAGSAGTGEYTLSLPPGYSIDLTKLFSDGFNEDSGVVGFGEIISNNTNSGNVLVVVVDSTHLGLITLAPAFSNSYQAWGNSSGFDFSHSLRISMQVPYLPIVGLSSNTLVGNDADARVVAAHIGLATNYSVGSLAVIKFDTIDFDTHSGYSPATGLYTVPVSGKYRVSATAIENTNPFSAFVAKNGSNIGFIFTVQATNQIHSGSITVDCKAGDTLAVFSDSSTTIVGQTPFQSQVNFEKISGPALPLATEFVGCLYYQAVSFSLSGSPQTITFSVKSYDSHGAFNPSTGIFTAPVSGKYRVHAKVNVQVTPTSITGATILGADNSTDGLSVRIDIEDHKQSASTFSRSIQGSITFNALAGGTININAVLSGASGGTVLGGGGDDGYINIEKVD